VITGIIRRKQYQMVISVAAHIAAFVKT